LQELVHSVWLQYYLKCSSRWQNVSTDKEEQDGHGMTAQKFYLNLHQTGNAEAVTGQCVALNKQSKKQLEPL
jgi:hypothetical protein